MNTIKKWEGEDYVASMGGHYDSIIETSPSSESDVNSNDEDIAKI